MSTRELEQQLEHLERQFEEIVASLDDPDIPDSELRDQIRAVVEKTDDDEGPRRLPVTELRRCTLAGSRAVPT